MNISTTILRSIAPVAFAALGLNVLGCLAGPSESGLTEEDFLGHAELGIAGDPGSTNHYDIGCFLDHGVQQTFRDLATTVLTGGKHKLPLNALQYLPSADATGELAGCRQEALALLVECALGPTQEAADPVSGEAYLGELGYATAWTTRALTTDEKELVTACMLQRLNPYGVSIAVLLEKPNSPNNTTSYPLHESEAWGNLFDSTTVLNPSRDPNLATAVPFDIFACDGGDQPSMCVDGTYSGGIVPFDPDAIQMRTCYFNFMDCMWRQMGPCTTICPGSSGECEAWDNRLRARLRDDGSACQVPLATPE